VSTDTKEKKEMIRLTIEAATMVDLMFQCEQLAQGISPTAPVQPKKAAPAQPSPVQPEKAAPAQPAPAQPAPVPTVEEVAQAAKLFLQKNPEINRPKVAAFIKERGAERVTALDDAGRVDFLELTKEG
jgi:hypothetical protein